MRSIDIVNILSAITLVITEKISDHVFADGKPVSNKIFAGHMPEIDEPYRRNAWEGQPADIKHIVEKSKEIDIFQHFDNGNSFSRLKCEKDDEGKWKISSGTVSSATFDFYQGLYYSINTSTQELDGFDYDAFATACVQDNPSGQVIKKFLLSVNDPSLGITPSDIRKLTAEHLRLFRKLSAYFFLVDKDDYSPVIKNLIEFVTNYP